MWQYQSASFLLLISGIIGLLIITATWSTRRTPIGLSFLIACASGTIWSFSEFITLGVTDPSAVVFWTGITFVGIGLLPTSVLVFTLYYTQRGHYLTRPILTVLILASTWQPIAVWTSPWHHLFYRDLLAIPIERGPLFVLHTAISYIITFTCAAILFLLHYRAKAYRTQVRLLLLVILFPGLANMVFVFRILPPEFSAVDLTPLAFMLMILMLSSRVFRGGLFTILPVAHRQIFYSLSNPLLVLDAQNNIVDMNKAAKKLIQRPLHEVLQLPAADVFPELATVLSDSQQQNWQNQEVNWLTTNKTYQVSINLLQDRRQNVRGKIILLNDITEQKETEQKLREQYEIVQELAKKLKSALHTADLANQAKDKFLANMSHELRTPLNAILGYTDLAVDQAQRKRYNELLPDLEKVQHSGNHLLDIITQILDLTKMATQNFDLYFEYFSFELLIQELKSEIATLASAQNNTVKVELEEDLPYVYGDERRVYQVLRNILHNSAKFTQNGRITIRISSKSDDQHVNWVYCEISDTGIGIPKSQLDIIFQPFAQVDDSMTRLYDGVGMGLTMSQQLCQLMGGKLEIASIEDVGTTVYLQFPTDGPNRADIMYQRAETTALVQI